LSRPRVAGGQVLLGDLVRAAPGLLLNLASTAVGDGRPRGDAPSFLTWALTERCPMTCQHCDMGRPTAELSRQERIALAHRLAASDVWGVSLIGGEPSLVSELGDLAAILVDAGKYVSVGTSGWKFRKHVGWVSALPLDTLTLSVDSHDEQTHDTFRGKAGLFAEVVEIAETLRSRRGPGETAKPQIQIRCTIHRGNFRELEAFMDFWTPRADRVLLQVVQNNGIHSVRSDETLFQPGDRPAFEAALSRLQRAYPELRSAYLDLAPRYVFEPEALYEDIGFRCLLVPATSLTVLPDGGTKLCYGREDSRVGNLLQDDLATIWRGTIAAQTRRRMQSPEFGCMCWEQACSGNLALIKGQSALNRLGSAIPSVMSRLPSSRRSIPSGNGT
jgi:MoaA/NifB/PqqE/SkfB family radical SAM enzyme